MENENLKNALQEERILIISARPYQFTDRNNGELRTGCTVEYIDSTAPVNEGLGYQTIKASLPLDIYDKFQGVCLARPIYTGFVNKDRKRETRLSDLNFIKTVDLFK